MEYNELISRGIVAMKEGRYAAALESFERAGAEREDERSDDRTRPNSPSTMPHYLEALRRTEVLQFLIDHYLDAMGWTRADYDGLGANSELLPRDTALERLTSLAYSRPEMGGEAGRYLVLAEADRLAQTGAPPKVSILNGTPPESADALFLLGEIAAASGNHREAEWNFRGMLAQGAANTFVYQALGRQLRALDQGRRAATCFNDAQMLATNYWLHHTHHQLDSGVTHIGSRPGWSCYRYRDRWIAVTPSRSLVVLDVGGRSVTLWLRKSDIKGRLRRNLSKRTYIGFAQIYRSIRDVHLLRNSILLLRPHVPRIIRVVTGRTYRRWAARRMKNRNFATGRSGMIFHVIARTLSLAMYIMEVYQRIAMRYWRQEYRPSVIELDSLAMIRRIRDTASPWSLNPSTTNHSIRSK